MNSNYFSGMAKVYNEEFFIDANTGAGLTRLLAKIDPLLFKMSHSLYIPGYESDDLKQELAIMAIEGVRVYDATKNVKLSTFLHIHLHNKLISKIKSKNKLSHNAFNVAEGHSLPSVCECGSGNFLITEKGGEELTRECVSCDRIYRKNIRTAKREVSFSAIDSGRTDINHSHTSFIDGVEDGGSVFGRTLSEVESIEIERSIDSACENLDEKIASMLKMIAFEDYSVQDAAEEVGMSPWSANLKLKTLAKNKKIKDMLLG